MSSAALLRSELKAQNESTFVGWGGGNGMGRTFTRFKLPIHSHLGQLGLYRQHTLDGPLLELLECV